MIRILSCLAAAGAGAMVLAFAVYWFELDAWALRAFEATFRRLSDRCKG